MTDYYYRKLRNTLAELFWDKSSAQRIVADANIRRELVTFSDNAIENWSNIIQEADNQGLLIRLVELAQEEYPKNLVLNDVLSRMKKHVSSGDIYKESITQSESLHDGRDEPPLVGESSRDEQQARQETAEREAAEKIAKKTTSPVQVSEESRSDFNEEKREKVPEPNTINNPLNDTKTSERSESIGQVEQWKIKTTNEAEQKADVQFTWVTWAELSVRLRRLRKDDLEPIKSYVEKLKEKSDPKYLNDNGDNLPNEHGNLPDLNAWALDLWERGNGLPDRLYRSSVNWGWINGAWEQLIKKSDLDEVKLIPLQRQLKATNDVITEIISDLRKSREQLITMLNIADIDNSTVESAIQSCHGNVTKTIKELENQQLRIGEMSDFFGNKPDN